MNARHRGDWFPLLARPAAASSFRVAAVDVEGEFLATHGVVLLDCQLRHAGRGTAAVIRRHLLRPVDGAFP
jgi:hypothetical protein